MGEAILVKDRGELSHDQPDRKVMGSDAQTRHAQQMPCAIRTVQNSHAGLPDTRSAKKLAQRPSSLSPGIPRHRPQGYSGFAVEGL